MSCLCPVVINYCRLHFLMCDLVRDVGWSSAAGSKHISPIEKPNPNHHLPSIADLLLQAGYANLCEKPGVEVETSPTFRTGSGKPVVVKQPSLVKASCILGDQDTGANADADGWETGGLNLTGRKKITWLENGTTFLVNGMEMPMTKVYRPVKSTGFTPYLLSILNSATRTRH